MLLLEFLNSLNEEGRSYSCINTARSAVSSLFPNYKGLTLGSHPLISRLMKAVYIIRPTKPRYEYIWDVADVFKYLRLLSPVTKLSLKDLSLKLIMLLALLTAGRCQSLVKLNLIHMKEGKSSVTFTILDVIKQSRPGFSNPLIRLEAYAPDRRLCVITVLREYVSSTQSVVG